MKVALLTYFASSSYGATLQTYSTIKMLLELNQEVFLVNYIIPEPYRPLYKNLLLGLKFLRFRRFRRKYYNKYLTSPYKNLIELQNNAPKADIYMIGSDQTWNPDISRDKAKGFFLDFGKETVKRVSYAASFGKSNWSDTNWISKAEAQDLLKRFDKILVREKSGQELLKGTFNIDSEHVLDPVLLYKDYTELTGPLNEINQIATFKLDDSADFYKKVSCISKTLKIPARILGSLRRKRGFINSYPEGVEEWIKQIACSKYVITDSFHGTVLSILYHRPFLVYVGRPEKFTRLEDLLIMLGLEDRIILDKQSDNAILKKLLQPINWDVVDCILDAQRFNSINLLKEILR